MDAAIPVDAKNAPTGIWKTAQNAVSHSAHTPIISVYEEERRPKRPTLINLSTDSAQVHQQVTTRYRLPVCNLLQRPAGRGKLTRMNRGSAGALRIEEYADAVYLRTPHRRAQPLRVEDRPAVVRELVEQLLADDTSRESRPRTRAEGLHDPRSLLRFLLTVRPPAPLPESFHTALDRLLEGELSDRGIVEASTLSPLTDAGGTVVALRHRRHDIESGVLLKWVPEKGFGFIRPETDAYGERDCFVHRSAFPEGITPAFGMRVRFDRVSNRNGRLEAGAIELLQVDGNR